MNISKTRYFVVAQGAFWDFCFGDNTVFAAKMSGMKN